jgi:uncharacterized membrane protein YfcA
MTGDLATDLLLYVCVGFAAQLIDGSVGMGYGVIATTVLIASGTPPALASAAVHLTKIPTGMASGFAHFRFGNVDRRLWLTLALFGIGGGVLGASFVSLAPLDVIRPLAASYLALMGVLVLRRARTRPRPRAPARDGRATGFFGGLFDSFGGGWGPIVSSLLLARGIEPRLAVGTLCAAEPLVALVQAFVFGLWLGPAALVAAGPAIFGLIGGALLAAPLSAYLVNRLPARLMVVLVGGTLVLLNMPHLVRWLAEP